LVFQENVLEDGAAVGYFVRGEVVLMMTCCYIHFFTLNFPEYSFNVLAETIARENKYKQIWYFVWLL
jgi:hypothetical protein